MRNKHWDYGLDLEIARELESALSAFRPPAEARARLLTVAAQLGGSLGPENSGERDRWSLARRDANVMHVRHPWDEAVGWAPALSGLAFATV